ncbi:MAG TPA: hypothetical protein VMW41_06030 [Candidatus Bathyarchaeia archaeon]|nr:hypothetical protein [Candidatus Bathyarchaeia archaeon]
MAKKGDLQRLNIEVSRLPLACDIIIGKNILTNITGVIDLSKINQREKFRRIDILDGLVLQKISGLKEQSYLVGLEILVDFLKKGKNRNGNSYSTHA